MHATERDITPVLQIWGWDSAGNDDDWTSTVGAFLPDDPPGPLAGENEQEVPM